MADDDKRPSLDAPKLFGRRQPKAEPDPEFEDTGSDTAVVEAVEADPDEPRARRTPRDLSVPQLSGPAAAVLTGAVVGLVLVGLTLVGSLGCRAVSGTSSCGPGVGFAALVVVVALTIVVGGLLLAAFAVPDPGATSLVGTGLACVVCLAVPPLLDHLDDPLMVVVLPAISVVTFALAWRLTTASPSAD